MEIYPLGFFKNWLINGKWIFEDNQGNKYYGLFLNGKKHDLGKLVDKNGNEIANGFWNNDNFVGKKNINEIYVVVVFLTFFGKYILFWKFISWDEKSIFFLILFYICLYIFKYIIFFN